MNAKGKQFKQILCLVLALVMIAGTFVTSDFVFSINALTDGAPGIEEEHTGGEENSALNELPSDENGEAATTPSDGVNEALTVPATEEDETNAEAAPIISDEPAAVADDTMEPGGICYVLFYDNGDLVFQLTEEADPERGTVKETYILDTSTAYETTNRLWYSIRTSVKKVVFADVIRPIRMDNWFHQMSGLTEFEGMENLDVSNVTSLSSTFSVCSSLTELNVSDWDVSQVTDLKSTFYGCSKLTELDLSGWNVSQVTTLYTTFFGCSSLTTLDLSNWDMSQVTTMYQAFINCSKLAELNLSGSVTGSALTSLSSTFSGCSSLTELDVSKWDMSQVEEMNTAFSGCSNLSKLDVSNWGVLNVKNMSNTFQNCSSLKELDLSGWNTSKVTSMSNTFDRGPRKLILGENFKFYGTSAFDKTYWRNEATNERYLCTDLYTAYNEDPINMAGTYIRDGMAPGGYCYALRYSNGDLVFQQTDEQREDADRGDLLNTYEINTSVAYASSSNNPWYSVRTSLKKVVFADEIIPLHMDYWFFSLENITAIENIEKLDTSNVTTMIHTFNSCKSLTELDVSSFDVSNVTSMKNLFNNCVKLTELDLSSWNVSNVTDISSIFRLCSALTKPIVSGWDVSRVTNMQESFYNCSALTELDLSSWNVSNLTSLYETFSGCSALTDLNISGWEITSKLTTLYHTFYNCSKLTELDLSGWNVSGVTNLNGTFYGCSSLKEIDLSSWNTANVTNTSNVFYRGPRKLILNETFKFSGTDAFDPTYWLHVETNERYSDTELCTAYNENPTDMAGTYIFDGMGPGGFCYALYYDNGDLVFQQFREPKNDVDRGELLNTYEVNTSTSYSTSNAPWNSRKSTVTKVVFADEIVPANMANWFYNMSNLAEVENGSNLKTFAVTSMNSTFRSCSKLTWMDTAGWDLSNVTTLYQTFYGCTALTAMDASNWNLSDKLTSFDRTFYNCSALITLTDTSGWDLSSVDTMLQAFYACNKLTELDTSNWGLSDKLTTMNQAFYNCKALTTLGATDWDLSGLTDTGLSATFYGCEALASLYSTNWGELANITTLQQTFYNCKALTTLDVSNWKIGNVTTLVSTFYGCGALTELDLSGWDVSKVTTLASTFYNCSGLTSLDLSKWNTESLSTMSSTFYGCSGLADLNVNGWNTAKVTTLQQAFYNCSGLTSLDLSSWNTESITSLANTFQGCSSLTNLDLNSWNTDSLTNLSSAFQNCSSLTDLNVSNWNTAKVTTVAYMIRGCTGLTKLNISGWDTGAVTTSTYADYYSGNPSSLLEITLGPNTDMQAALYLFELGLSNGAKWVKEGTETPMSVAEMRAQRRSEQPAEPETWYRVRTVTFDPNGGIAVPSSIGEWWPGKDIGEHPTATRRGADFDGWWTEIVGGERLQEGTNPTNSIYYAHWKEHKYTLILDSNNGTHEQVIVELAYSDSYKLSSTLFTDPWAVITAWHTRPAGTGIYGANEELISLTEEDGGEIRLYAQWTSLENVINIAFDAQGGTEIPLRQMERGDKIGNSGRLPVPVRAGFSFEGWYIRNEDGSIGDKADENTVFYNDATLVAIWKNDLLVQFDFNMGLGSTIVTRTVAYGKKIGELPIDIYNGRYRAFIGWFTDPTGGEQISADRIITDNVTFYAHWGWRPRFNANGGKFSNPLYLADYEITESSYYLIENFPEVEYDGYRLIGWYHGDTKITEGSSVDLSKGTEIYALWERDNTVKITLMANGGKMTSANGYSTYETLVYEVYAGNRVAELPVPTRDGYEFLGWADLTGQIPDEYCTRNSVFNQNATLIACWAQKDCAVTFDRVEDDARFYNTSSATKIVNVPNGWTVNTLPGCTRADYILEGWYTQRDGNGEKLTTETEITGNVTYYANWIPFTTTGTTTLHEFTYGAEWANANNANVDNVGNNLEFHPQDNTNQIAQLRVYFELNNSYGEGGALPIGSVYIKIPKYVFLDPNGSDIGECNLTDWFVEYPNIPEGDNVYFSYIDGGDCYYLVNNQPIDTGGQSINIEYSVTPNKLDGGAVNEDGRYVDGYKYFQNEIEIEFGINEKPGDPEDPKPWIDPDSKETKALSLEMHTKVDTTASKTFSTFVYEWDEKTWGPKPNDAADYFYIIWKLSESYKYYTNQPSEFQWSEDESVHDGTIVYISSGENGSHSGNGSSSSHTCTVVTKHPIELMQDVPSVGRTFYNEAIVTETWRSGYITQHRVNASATIYPDNYGRGEFEKDRYNNSHLISGGQEDVLDDHKQIDMPWEIWYDGGSNVRPTWDEDTKQYYAPNRTIRITDGLRSDLMYSSGRASSKYIWEPNTGNFDLNDDDYYFYALRISLTEYDAISEDGIWSEKTANNDTSKYEPIQIWVRYKDKEEFVFYQSINYSGAVTVSLPENVAGFQVIHTSSFYWTYLSIKADMKLVPTQKIMTWVQSDVDAQTTSIIKNVAHCEIWLTDEGEESTFFDVSSRGGDYTSALDDLYELNISSTYQYTTKSAGTVRIDPNTGAENVPMVIRGYNYNPSGRMKKLKSGVFYDLLPTGTSVDPESVICIPESSVPGTSLEPNSYDTYVDSKSKLDTAMYDVRFVKDWEGSGRTMMIIKFTVPENKYPSVSVLYMLRNTYENIKFSGLTVTNDVAFVNTSAGRVWPDGLDGSITDIPKDDQGFYADLQLNNEGFISYAQASAKYTAPAVQSWGFDKRVMTNTEYKVSDSTLPGKTYTYRLAYSQSSTTISKNMVLYDVLEQSARRRDDKGNPTDQIISEWQGAFVDVRVEPHFQKSQATELKWTVYYSTVERERFNLEAVTDPATYELCDLSNPNYWSTTEPKDKSSITAIAVDFSKNTANGNFVMNGEGTLEVYITMQAPKDAEKLIDKTAYNEAVFYSQQGTAESVTPLYSDAQVELKDFTPKLEKTSDPESGTKEKPKIVENQQEITYTLKVTNTDEERIMNDTVVTDEVPQGLYIITKEIMVHFGNPNAAMPVEESVRVNMQKEDQKLTFTISTLRPGETAYIEIPVVVYVTSAVFENSAKITEVDGVSKSIESKPNYHEVVPSTSAILQLEKRVVGRVGPIGEGEFSFRAELMAIDDKAVTPKPEEIYEGSTSGASGWVTLGPINYDADSEGHVYKYKITETEGNDKHISYSADTIYALVEIVDTRPEDELNAFLVANKTYYSDEECTLPIENMIENIPIAYNKYWDGADLEITKAITGDEKIIKPGEFTFTAVPVTNDSLEPIAGGRRYNGSTVNADGRVTFEPIPYSADDAGNTYTFKITENEGDEKGVTYSDEVIYAALTITLGEDNGLSYSVSYFTVKDGARIPLSDPTITNTYSEKDPFPVPDFGGMGKAPFMIAGAVLVLLSAGTAYLTKTKKKKHN